MSNLSQELPLFAYEQAMLAELNSDNYESLVDLFERACYDYAGRIAFTVMGQDISFAEIDRKSAAFAAYLLTEAALQPGSRVAIQLPNIGQYPMVAWGAIRAGMVVVNTNPMYTARELEHQFNDSGATTLVAMAELLPQITEVIPRTGIERVISTSVFDLMEAQAAPECDLPGLVTLPEIFAQCEGRQWARPQMDMNSVALLQYTGGTTGPAKGAVLTQGNIFASAQQSAAMAEPEDDSPAVVLGPMPLYHIYGFTMHVVSTFCGGGKSVLIPDPRDIDSMVAVMKAQPFTAMAGVNTLFVSLLAHPEFDEIDFSRVDGIIAGGAALVEEIASEWQRRTGTEIFEGYGLSETAATLTCNSPESRQLGTVGKPMISMQIKIVDKAGKSLGAGEEGELLVRGPQVMHGYWNRLEATAEALDAEGWFRTGDIAMIQQDGYVKICDRLKDMILVSGFNVYPNEIEAVLYTHPDVVECAAVGVPDEKSGEAVKLFVVSSNPAMDEATLRAFCREQMTAYKVPRIIEFRQQLPKSNVGKILRRELRDTG
jgi:long-chain acyl-CoA synthetase